MRFLNTRTDPAERISAALTQSNSLDLPEVEATVRTIVDDVRQRGDAAVQEHIRRLDGVDLSDFAVSEAEFDAAEGAVDREFVEAVETAIANVRAFHEQQRRGDLS